MDKHFFVILGIKVKRGPIERYKIENLKLDNTAEHIKNEAAKKTNLPSASLELIYHGKILKNDISLQDSGVKSGEMIHVVKKKVDKVTLPPPTYTDAELQAIISALKSLGNTPNAVGWTRAMQLINIPPAMEEIMEQAPSLADDCVTRSILHEVELLAAIGADVDTMRTVAEARPGLPSALRHLTKLVQSWDKTLASESVPLSGFAYSLEALSEEDEEEDDESVERNMISRDQLLAAIQAATEAVVPAAHRSADSNLLRLLCTSAGETSRTPSGFSPGTPSGGSRAVITPEAFSEAISAALTRTGALPASETPMDQSVAGESSSQQSPTRNSSNNYYRKLERMHEMGLVDDAVNSRALFICSGDVNAAINLVLSGAITDTSNI